MAITNMTSREFNQDVSKAKRAAAKGPVFITDRGHPAHVLLTIERYQEITKKKPVLLICWQCQMLKTLSFARHG